MSAENAFAGIEDVKRAGGAAQRGFLTEGTYIVEVEKNVLTQGKNKSKDSFGQDIIITEGTILEVTRNIPGVSLKPGEQFVVIDVLARGRGDVLTAKGEKAMSRVKARFGAILGGVPDTDITPVACAAIVKGDGTELAGTRLKVNASKGKPMEGGDGEGFTFLDWESID